MEKPLEEMSREELWQLFPIFLVAHKDEWEAWYQDETKNILALFSKGSAVRLSHIGSTAVPGIWAKNIVDILLEVKNDPHIAAKTLEGASWRVMSRENGRISLNKGYTQSGFDDRVFHLHIRRTGDNDELYFRDYLCENPAVAREYEKLKLILWEKYPNNRDAYTDAKGEFIRRYTAIAKREYRNRYDVSIPPQKGSSRV